MLPDVFGSGRQTHQYAAARNATNAKAISQLRYVKTRVSRTFQCSYGSISLPTMNESHTGYRIILLAIIIAANGFFAASETALLSSRKSRLRQLAESGNVGAQAALNLLGNPERLLSVVQFGVTLASLGLGWAGEETIFRIISGMMEPLESAAS